MIRNLELPQAAKTMNRRWVVAGTTIRWWWNTKLVAAAMTTIDALGDNPVSGGWTPAASPAMLDNPE
jgi:hypothetical protein